MATTITEPRAPQTYTVPNVDGTTTISNTVGVAGAQVIALDTSRSSITFANPNLLNQVNLLVYQMKDANGNALAPTFASPGGGFPLVPGAILTFTGDIQGAWGAVAQSGSTNGISIMSSRS